MRGREPEYRRRSWRRRCHRRRLDRTPSYPPDEPQVKQVALGVDGRVLQRDRSRHTVAELGGVGQLVDAGDDAATADQAVEVVTGVVDLGSVELGNRLTHCEPSELDERVVDAERTSGDAAVVRVADRRSAAVHGGASGRGGTSVVTRGPGERRIEVGAQDAVFGRGARIDVEVLAGTLGVIVRIAVLEPFTPE